jgi:hypothetical protein
VSVTFTGSAQPLSDVDTARRFETVFDEIRSKGLEMIPGQARLEVLEYRTHPYSYIARVRIHGDTTAITAFVKLLRLKNDSASHLDAMRRRVHNEFEAASTVHRGFAGGPGGAAVQPLACFPEYLALVTAEAAGDPLNEVLERHAGWNLTIDRLDALRAVHSKVGGWLRKFQALRPGGGTLPRERLLEYVDIRLKRLVRQPKAKFSEADRTLVLRYVDAKSRQVCDADLRETWTHADFGPSNVLVHNGEVTVIDFAMAGGGTMLNDVARMYTQLEWFAAKPKFRAATIRALQQALLSGFDPHLTEETPLFELMVLQHRINHFLGLVERPEGMLSKIYNWHLARRDRVWVRAMTGGLIEQAG